MVVAEGLSGASGEGGDAVSLVLLAHNEAETIEGEILEFYEAVLDRLPGSEFLFQTTSPKYVNQQDIVPAVNQTRAVLKWGIASGRELCEWDRRFRFIAEWAFVDRHRKRWRSVLRWWFLPHIYRDLRQTMKVTHMRIGD